MAEDMTPEEMKKRITPAMVAAGKFYFEVAGPDDPRKNLFYFPVPRNTESRKIRVRKS